MEEKTEDVIYDLNAPHASHAEGAEVVGAQGESESSTTSDSKPEDGATSNPDSESEAGEPVPAAELVPDGAQTEGASGAAVRMTAPHEELKRMVEEMGAETLLEIIRDNRNAAIRQILSEVEASRPPVIPSGDSVAKEFSSIFDLAALA